MKLVLTYSINGGYSCGSYDVVLPIEYSSEEALIVDFETAIKEALKYSYRDFVFGNYTFSPRDFYYDASYTHQSFTISDAETIQLPEIYTLEDWFNKNNICP